MSKTWMTLVAVAALGAGCGDAEWVEELDEPGADRAGEAAEKVAEDRLDGMEDETDPLSEEIREEVAEERAELATDVGADPGAMIDEEARTAAGHLAARGGDEHAAE